MIPNLSCSIPVRFSFSILSIYIYVSGQGYQPGCLLALIDPASINPLPSTDLFFRMDTCLFYLFIYLLFFCPFQIGKSNFFFSRVSPTVHVCNNNWFTDVRYICTYACWGWNPLPQVMFRFALCIAMSMRKRMDHPMISRPSWGSVLFGLACVRWSCAWVSIYACGNC